MICFADFLSGNEAFSRLPQLAEQTAHIALLHQTKPSGQNHMRLQLFERTLRDPEKLNVRSGIFTPIPLGDVSSNQR
jgi:hypothetical protein